MQAGRIPGHTRIIGKSQGFIGLPVRDSDTDGQPVMETAWEPMPDELARLNAGAPVILRVLGTAHPPVQVTVGEPPQ